MPLIRRIRFLYALLALHLGMLLLATVMDWTFAAYYMVTYIATLALVEIIVAPVWRVRWNRRTYLVLFFGLVAFLVFAGELVLT